MHQTSETPTELTVFPVDWPRLAGALEQARDGRQLPTDAAEHGHTQIRTADGDSTAIKDLSAPFERNLSGAVSE